MAVHGEARRGLPDRAHADWDPARSRSFLREVGTICARVQSPELLERTLSDLMARCERGEVACDRRVLDFFRQLPEMMRLTRGEGGSHGTSQTMKMASWERDAAEMISAARRDEEWLNRFWSSFMTSFERGGAQETGEKLRNGILGALGSEHLARLLGYEAKAAKPDVDVHYSIDFLATPKEGRRAPLAIQAKGLSRQKPDAPKEKSFAIRLVGSSGAVEGDADAQRLSEGLARMKAERPGEVAENTQGLLVRLPRLWQNEDGRVRPFLHEQTGEIAKEFFPIVREEIQKNAPELLSRERPAA